MCTCVCTCVCMCVHVCVHVLRLHNRPECATPIQLCIGSWSSGIGSSDVMRTLHTSARPVSRQGTIVLDPRVPATPRVPLRCVRYYDAKIRFRSTKTLCRAGSGVAHSGGLCTLACMCVCVWRGGGGGREGVWGWGCMHVCACTSMHVCVCTMHWAHYEPGYYDMPVVTQRYKDPPSPGIYWVIQIFGPFNFQLPWAKTHFGRIQFSACTAAACIHCHTEPRRTKFRPRKAQAEIAENKYHTSAP